MQTGLLGWRNFLARVSGSAATLYHNHKTVLCDATFSTVIFNQFYTWAVAYLSAKIHNPWNDTAASLLLHSTATFYMYIVCCNTFYMLAACLTYWIPAVANFCQYSLLPLHFAIFSLSHVSLTTFHGCTCVGATFFNFLFLLSNRLGCIFQYLHGNHEKHVDSGLSLPWSEQGSVYAASNCNTLKHINR